MNSIIKELKRKRESNLDESAKELKYEEVYSSEDISDVEKFKSDVEDIGGKVIVKGDELTAVVPHEQKVALKNIEGKYFDGVDEAAGSKTPVRRMAGAGAGRDMKSGTVVATSKKGRVFKSMDSVDLEKGLLKCAKKYKMKNLQNEYDLVATYLSDLYSSSNSKFEKQMVESLYDGEVISKKDLLTLLMRGCGEDYFLDLVVDESIIDEAFGVGNGFENVLTISGSREELNGIAKRCGVDIRDIKLNRVAEKQFLSGNSFGVVEGNHLVVLTKDKKYAGNLMLVIDKGEYIPDAIPLNESAEDDMIIEVAGNDFPMKNLLKSDKSVSKRVKEILKKENGSIDIDFFGNTVYPMLHEDFPEYFNETFSGILEEIGRPLTSKELKTISKNIDKLENDDDLWEQKNISKYILDNYDESEKETCYEMEIPMEDLVDEDGEEIDVEEVLEAAKSCKGVNEAEALEDCIRIRYDESCEKELIGKLEECGINADIEEEE